VSASCIYEGTIRHRRSTPRREFRHRIALAYVDLDELPALLGGRFVRPRPGALRFRRGDYHGDASVPLSQAVRDTVERHAGVRPRGPVRLLTQLRSFGHCFNPVSFYYCIRGDGDGDGVEAIVTEVTNTPWGERHAYVLHAGEPRSRVLRASFEKALHVSPFMAMDHTYALHATVPASTLSVHIESRRAGALAFDATLALRRRELTAASARSLSARYPLETVRVLALIYAHGLRLRLAGARAHAHPAAATR
jgi:hypothetical protein